MTGFLLTILLLAVGPDEDARAALALAQKAPVKASACAADCQCGGPGGYLCKCAAGTRYICDCKNCTCKPAVKTATYDDLYNHAVRENIPLVLCIDYNPGAPANCLLYLGTRAQFPGESGILIGVPKDGKLIRIDLPDSASTDDIRRAINDLRRSWEPVTPTRRSEVRLPAPVVFWRARSC